MNAGQNYALEKLNKLCQIFVRVIAVSILFCEKPDSELQKAHYTFWRISEGHTL